ncbi:hypothetical protein BT63DRAFT_401593 [Microthyrium microscopicum]|uniref:Ubiquitin-like 1-activating enzyme E1A n=1 Tax=Microthyrium microscopicum TaxID=703497 RepID=A0A6A6UB04_9PEZI|nr:hypothetical protein BT63DRAFT_401593 [Microthyrium microscopicum]
MTDIQAPPAQAHSAANDSMSADEIALYDRQIRLWGVQAQEYIRKANVLLISMKALANEVAKNLVLAGINTLTIIDHELVTEEDLGAEFFVSMEDVGKNRAMAAAPRISELNPRVKVFADNDSIADKHESYVKDFDVIIATDLNFKTMTVLNAACRLANKPFYAAGSHGFYGFIFADLISHDFIHEETDSHSTRIANTKESATRTVINVEVTKEGKSTRQIVTRREMYSPMILANTSPLPPTFRRNRLAKVTPLLSCLRALWDFEEHSEAHHVPQPNSASDIAKFTSLATEKHTLLNLPRETLKAEFLRKFLQNVGSQIAPVTAMLGGLLGQDVINVIGKREQPIQNFCLFNGDDYDVPVFALHPVNFEKEGEKSTKLETAVEGMVVVD